MANGVIIPSHQPDGLLNITANTVLVGTNSLTVYRRNDLIYVCGSVFLNADIATLQNTNLFTFNDVNCKAGNLDCWILQNYTSTSTAAKYCKAVIGENSNTVRFGNQGGFALGFTTGTATQMQVSGILLPV